MTDAPHPPHQAVAPDRKPKKPSQVQWKGKPIGHGSGRAKHTLKPHQSPLNPTE